MSNLRDEIANSTQSMRERCMGKGRFERRSTHQRGRRGRAMRGIVGPRRADQGGIEPPASNMKLEATRTPVLALRMTAEQHAADGEANLAKDTGRERVVGAPKAVQYRACRRCDLLGKPRITCQLQVEGEQ